MAAPAPPEGAEVNPRTDTVVEHRGCRLHSTQSGRGPKVLFVQGVGRALHAGIPGSRDVEIADASHGWPITHAEQANTLLHEHLSAAEVRKG